MHLLRRITPEKMSDVCTVLYFMFFLGHCNQNAVCKVEPNKRL